MKGREKEEKQKGFSVKDLKFIFHRSSLPAFSKSSTPDFRQIMSLKAVDFVILKKIYGLT